jgi:hypothetical protein
MTGRTPGVRDIRNIKPKGEIIMKFNPGQLVMTRGVNDLVADNAAFAKHVHQSLRRHLAGDWGDVCAEDRASNESALMDGDRLLSVYVMVGLLKIWIITEWDRSVTTILFPDEY